MYDFKEKGIKKERYEIIGLFYQYMIMNLDVDQMKQDVLSEKHAIWKNEKLGKYVLEIAENFEKYKEEIEEKFKNGWTWNRIPNLIKAILVVGTAEIENTDIDKAITINEMTEIAKENQPDWDYKFVNAILDKMIKF